MPSTSNLGLLFIEAGQAQKHVTHNEALRLLDTLVQLAVLDRDLNAPPGSPAEGQRWLVKASPSPTGAWAGRGNQIAAWQDGGWQFSAPKTGWVAYVVDEGALLYWDGDSWEAVQLATALQNLTLLGVGTTADTTNPLSAKLNNALFTARYTAEGGDGDLRCKLNKEATGDTVSQLYQKGFSGRAETGLVGNDDFTFKVSPDGSTWYDGIVIRKDDGKVAFPSGIEAAYARERLSANRTYYVRTDGSDANSGLVNNAGGAFLTIQKAFDTAVLLDLAGYTVTVQIGDGTYAPASGTPVLSMAQSWTGGGAVIIQGNSGAPANVVLSATAADAINVATALPGLLTLKDFKLQTTTSGSCLFLAGAGRVDFSGLNFGSAASRHIYVGAKHIVNVIGDYSISGGATWHIQAGFGGGTLQEMGHTITLSGTPNFSSSFCVAAAGFVIFQGTVFSGSATGARYSVNMNGVISVNGAGANYLPGDAAGSTASGGQYV